MMDKKRMTKCLEWMNNWIRHIPVLVARDQFVFAILCFWLFSFTFCIFFHFYFFWFDVYGKSKGVLEVYENGVKEIFQKDKRKKSLIKTSALYIVFFFSFF